MAFQGVKKMLGISAVVIVMGTVMFTFTSCGQATPQEPTATIQEVEETQEQGNGGNIANDIDLQQKEVEATQSKEITVFYDQCATEADTLEVTGENGQADYTVKDYKAPIFNDYMQGLNYEYEYSSEEGALYLNGDVVSSNVEAIENEDGTTTLHVKDYKMQNSIPVVKYVRVSPEEVEARYIGTAPLDSNMVSGITFVMNLDENGYYILTGMQGVFGEDISKLPVYEGTFKGWSLEQDGEPVFSPQDQIKIGDSMTLLPYFEDNEYSKTANADGTCVEGQLEEIDGMTVLRIIHINHNKTDKDGNTTLVVDYALSGLNTEKDTVKNTDGTNVDKETVTKQQTDDSNGGSENGENGSGNGGKSNGDNGKGTDSGSGTGGKSDNGGSKSGGESGSANGGGATNGSDGSANSDANKNQTGAQTTPSESSQAGDLNDFANMFGVAPVNPDTTPGSWEGGGSSWNIE